VVRGLSEEQALKLLQCIDRHSPAGRRDYAICQLLYTYGVRGGQVRALQFEDIDWTGNQVLCRVQGSASPLVRWSVSWRSVGQWPALRWVQQSVGRVAGCTIATKNPKVSDRLQRDSSV
jgi:site-specific recombinase XerC